MSQSTLPYAINDADNHFNEPIDLYERYIDPQYRDKAIRTVRTDDGREIRMYGDKPSTFFGENDRVRELKAGSLDAQQRVPGTLLNRMNPFKGMSEEEKRAFVAEFRHREESYGNRELRLALMDEQGIGAALMYPATVLTLELEYPPTDVGGMYANIRAFNRWVHEEVGFAHEKRMFLPAYMALADVDLAVEELERVLAQRAPIIQIRPGHAHGGRDNSYGGRSVADPVFDPFWARVNEAGARVAIHGTPVDYCKYLADWSEDPDAPLGRMTAFQWMFGFNDIPAMHTIAAMIFHGLFTRFPNIRVCMSEQGSVWVPFVVRKMDHAFLMGRRATWDNVQRRPRELFAEHFVVAPFPEENVRRLVDEVGLGPVVFGSDFPHGEGLPFPARYVDAQLVGFSEDEVRAIMHDNLGGFLGQAA
jgi:predicted TIM-barrel fold metal-dependent hydrolase